VSAFFPVDLEQITQVVERWAGKAELPLLFHRRGLGVALGHDQPPQRRSVFTGDVLPHRFTAMVTERDGPAGVGLGQEDAPTVLGHFYEAGVGPAIGFDADGGAQIDIEVGAAVGSQVLPPLHVVRLP
jgi:hypothetical protein